MTKTALKKRPKFSSSVTESKGQVTLAPKGARGGGSNGFAVGGGDVSPYNREFGNLSKKDLEALKKRDELIAQYMPYAASIASRVYQTLSKVVEYDEVLSSARLGLLEAAKRYNENAGVDFKTFAYYRVKGAIYDGLRKAGWIPRTLYAKLKFEEAANDYLQYMSEYADSRLMDGAEEEVAETVNSLASIYIISLDSTEDFDIEDTNVPTLEKSSEFRQIRLHMREAINSLPPTEKKLIKMYYFQNKTLEQVGLELNLSKSWTSRLHARALEILLETVKKNARKGKEGESAFAHLGLWRDKEEQ